MVRFNFCPKNNSFKAVYHADKYRKWQEKLYFSENEIFETNLSFFLKKCLQLSNEAFLKLFRIINAIENGKKHIIIFELEFFFSLMVWLVFPFVRRVINFNLNFLFYESLLLIFECLIFY